MKMQFFIIFLILNSFLISESENKSINSRVIGGDVAPISQYSFIAAIDVQTPTSRYFCGGALYTSQWILTAGQCVDGATLFNIHLGSGKRTEADPSRLTLATSEFVLHPDYRPMTLENDIGLIRLRMPIEYSDFIRPIYPLALAQLEPTNHVRVVGWGQTSDTNSSLSEELRVVNASPLSNIECQMIYGNQITDTMVCVSGNYNQGACNGDTGSPLLDTFSKYTAIHVGIASFLSFNGCESTDPSGFTRTFPYKDWIGEITDQS